jgi:hypothetical protein
MMRRQSWVVFGVMVMIMPWVAAADGRPSWECLPADTAFMVRVPALAEFWDTIQTRTKFGAVALSPKRLEGLWQAFASIQDDEEEWSLEQYEESLRKYGLETSDLLKVLDAECGGGLVLRQRDGQEPLAMILAWFEPGDEGAGKLLAAIRQRLEESADKEHAPKRTDIELAGHDVMMTTVPVIELDTDSIDVPDDGEFDEAALDALVERMKDAKAKKTGEKYTFVAVMDGRFLVGSGLTTFAGPEGDADDAAGVEELRRIFATFLEAHAGGGEPALAAVYREPAIAAAALPGMPLVEMVVVPSVLVAAVAAESEFDEGTVQARLATVGIDDIGSVVLRQNFDNGRWKATMAMTLPAPRHGFLEVLDQPCDASEVPAFVTREVAEFGQLSLDLGAAYKTVRQLLLAQAQGEQVANMFSVADMQSQAWLGVDVAAVLSGLGTRHWFLTFPPQIADVVAKARAADENDGEVGSTVADRLAAVWQIADEGPYGKLLGRLAQLAGGGQLEEEQGFKGVRIPGGAAFYVGRGHLVMAVGEGVLEKTLAAIRTPPQGDTSLRESDVPRRAAELLPARPARGYGVSDATRTGGSIGMLRDLAEAMEPDDIEDESMRGAFVAFKELLPSAREMEGMFGIGTTLLRMTDDGLLYETAWEMPAP